MALRRFFAENSTLDQGQRISLPANESRHIRRVLRLREGDNITIFNGEKEFTAELTKIGEDSCEVLLLEEVERESLVTGVSLVLSLIRPANMELALQKATELGAAEFFPMESAFSQTKAAHILGKYDRWEKILVEACKQSERPDIPVLHPPASLTTTLDVLKTYDLVIAAHSRTDGAVPLGSLAEDIRTASKVAILIGPEGGFSEAELEEFRGRGFRICWLEGNVLRAETAAVAFCAIVGYLRSGAAQP